MSALLWYPGHELLLADIARAENCSLYDSSGRRYVDLESGVWCTPVGHGHPRWLRSLGEQAAAIAHSGFGYSCEIVERAARDILVRLEFESGRCAFLSSGSEAVELGVRAIQTVSTRPLLLTMADSYFGAYGSAHQRRSGEWFGFDWTPCASCPAATPCGAQCPHWAAIPFEGIAGFVFEPGSSSGLVRFPPAKLIRGIAARVKQDGGLILVNEVTTGIGRTGRWFGFQHYEVAPDVVALGKGIGNGYPVSACAFSAGVAARLAAQPLRYAQSHQNDPLGAAVAREVLAIVRDEGLIERGRDLGVMLAAGLAAIKARTGRIREIRGRGLMIAIELEDDAPASFTVRLHRELVHRGYILGRRPGLSVLRLDPALTIPRADVAGFLATFESALGSA